jgi:hypothetical protein
MIKNWVWGTACFVALSACGGPQALGLKNPSVRQDADPLSVPVEIDQVTLQNGQIQRSMVNRARFRVSTDLVPDSLCLEHLVVRDVQSGLEVSTTLYSVHYDTQTREIEWILNQADQGRSLSNGSYQFEIDLTALEALNSRSRFASKFTYSFHRLEGDFNGNGTIEVTETLPADRNLLLAVWGQYTPETMHFDLNLDLRVDNLDLGILLGLL